MVVLKHVGTDDMESVIRVECYTKVGNLHGTDKIIANLATSAAQATNATRKLHL